MKTNQWVLPYWWEIQSYFNYICIQQEKIQLIVIPLKNDESYESISISNWIDKNTYPGARRGKIEIEMPFQGKVEDNGKIIFYNQKHFNTVFRLIESKTIKLLRNNLSFAGTTIDLFIDLLCNNSIKIPH